MGFNYKDRVIENIFSTGQEIYKKGELLPLNKIIEQLELTDGVPMHAPYHHIIVPYTLLIGAAIKENINEEAYLEMWEKVLERGQKVPGGFCGNCGACGSSVGVGIFISVYTGASPMTKENWQWANEGTANALLSVAEYPGPRCCKRTCFLSLKAASKYLADKLDLHLPIDEDIECIFYRDNKQCIGRECPFFPV